MNQWLEISINTTDGEIDALADALTINGVTGLVLESEADFRTFLEHNRQYWDYVDEDLAERMRGVARIKLYVTDDDAGRAQLAQWLEGINAPYTAVSLREEDWANNWKQFYKPLPVGERLYIVPEWERNTAPLPEGKVPLYLNPGLIFGTGSHASTQLCLEGVERYAAPGASVLDLGCGSGILSIAALCLGAGRAVGVDIDPKAVGVAYENAAMNGIGKDRYTVAAGDVLSDRPLAAKLAEERYGLVLANIVADVIIPLATQVDALLAEDGVFLCSGIIDTRSGEVRAALERAGLAVIEDWERTGWVAFAAKRA